MFLDGSEPEPVEPHWTRRLFTPLCIIALAVGIFLLSEIHYIKNVEHWTADWRTALASRYLPSQHENIALVLVTEETLEESATRIPMDRAMLARVIDAVASAEPAAIGLDILFLKAFDGAADTALMKAVQAAKPPLVLAAIDDRIRIPPKQLAYHHDFVRRSGRPVGHIFFERPGSMFGISDQVVRQMADLPSDPTRMRSFAHVLAQYERPRASQHNRRIDWLLTPADGSQTFFEVEAQDLLGSPDQIEPWLAGLKGKIVLIGTDLVDADRHLTPLSIIDDQRMSGVKVHAHIVAQLIEDRWITEPTRLQQLLLLLLLAIAGYLAGRQAILRKHKGKLAWAGSVALVAAGFGAFKYAGIILPYAAGLTAWLAAIGLDQRIDKLYRSLRLIYRFFVLRGGWRWRTLHRLAVALVSRYWRERL